MTYKVRECFLTVQGEGARAGTLAVFVRLAGCNLWNGRPEDRGKGAGACAMWCDTLFTGGTKLDAKDIARRAVELWDGRAADRWIVLTGGEPLLQADAELLGAFHAEGFRVAVETNGTLMKLRDGTNMRADGLFDWICVSPKRGSDWILRVGDELKVVLPGAPPPDGWSLDELRQMREELSFAHYFVQPQDPIDPAYIDVSALNPRISPTTHRQTLVRDYDQNVARCMDAVARGWRISLQTHKLMGLP